MFISWKRYFGSTQNNFQSVKNKTNVVKPVSKKANECFFLYFSNDTFGRLKITSKVLKIKTANAVKPVSTTANEHFARILATVPPIVSK